MSDATPDSPATDPTFVDFATRLEAAKGTAGFAKVLVTTPFDLAVNVNSVDVFENLLREVIWAATTAASFGHVARHDLGATVHVGPRCLTLNVVLSDMDRLRAGFIERGILNDDAQHRADVRRAGSRGYRSEMPSLPDEVAFAPSPSVPCGRGQRADLQFIDELGPIWQQAAHGGRRPGQLVVYPPMPPHPDVAAFLNRAAAQMAPDVIAPAAGPPEAPAPAPRRRPSPPRPPPQRHGRPRRPRRGHRPHRPRRR